MTYVNNIQSQHTFNVHYDVCNYTKSQSHAAHTEIILMYMIILNHSKHNVYKAHYDVCHNTQYW